MNKIDKKLHFLLGKVKEECKKVMVLRQEKGLIK